MTNEQLKILLEGQSALLRIAIEKTAELMPDDAEMRKKTILITAPPGIATVDSDQYIALIPLYEHLELIERQIDSLSEPDYQGAPA